MATITLKKIRVSAFAPKGAYSNTKTNFCVPLSRQTGTLVNIFAKDDDLRKELEKELSLNEGDLLPTSAYYKEFSITMRGDTMVFDTENPLDKLALKMFEYDNLVAISEEDRLKKAEAIYILIKETEVAETKVNRRKIKAEAYSMFSKMNIEDMKNTLLLYGKNVRSLSELKIKELLGDEVEDRPSKFLSLVTDKDFSNKVLINDLIQENVITKSGSVYMFDGEPIAHDTLDMVNYMKDKKNAQMVITFKKILSGKKGVLVE